MHVNSTWYVSLIPWGPEIKPDVKFVVFLLNPCPWLLWNHSEVPPWNEKKRVITCENHQSSKLTLSLDLHCPSPWLVRESVKCKSFTLKRFFGGKNYLVAKLGTLSVGDDERISTKLKIVSTTASSFFNLIWLCCWIFFSILLWNYIDHSEAVYSLQHLPPSSRWKHGSQGSCRL